MLIQDWLQDSARRFPGKTALVFQGKRLTYAELDALTNRLAQAMIQHGARRGDRVALFLNNSVEMVAGLFATLKAGGTFVPVNHSTKPDKLVHLLNHCGATGLLLEARAAARGLAQRLIAEVPSLRFLMGCGRQAADPGAGHPAWLDFEAVLRTFPDRPLPRVNIDLDLACLIYTSGTTGESKGVMCDHSNVAFVTGSIIEYLRNTETDIILSALPMSFSYGLLQVLTTIRFGGTLVAETSFAYPVEILKRIEHEKVTGLPGIPTIYAMLLQLDLGSFNLSSLRYLTNAAAALPVSHLQMLRQRLPGISIYPMHGLTEAMRTLYLPPDWVDRRPASVGLPIPGTEAWLEDDHGNRVGPGTVGELVVRGRHVMRGYWNDPEGSAQRFRPGPIPGERVCHTGDLFTVDAEGCYSFVSRKDDVIKSRGEKVAPLEVEHVLHRLKGVVEAAVVGVPDPILGQAIKAVLVVDAPALTVTEVLAHCRARLEDYKVPQVIEFRNELPKTASGKLKRRELVEAPAKTITP